MIEGFEDFTHDLTDKENELLPGFIKGLQQKKSKENAITNSQIVQAYKAQGVSINGARIRKLINYIRLTGQITNLVASKKGYYVTDNREELEDYIHSLKSRALSILAVAESIEKSIK